MKWSHSMYFKASHLESCWLSASGSLTSRLKALGPFGLEVLSEESNIPHPDETAGPESLTFSTYRIREVLMYVHGTPCIAARSLIPENDDGAWSDARTIGDAPLGTILYNGAVTRTSFAFAVVQNESALHKASAAFARTGTKRLARRSRFLRSGIPILVSECFLPDFWNTEMPTKLTMECLG